MSRAAKVLLCDDSRLALMKLRKLFEEMGAEIVGAHQSGPEAIEAYKEAREEVDLVSLDLVMPGMDGLEVLAELKEFDPEVKVLILSSIVQPEIEAQARELGAAGVLEKPYDAVRIQAVLDEVLGAGA
jgi:two-component system chemotaxis response regulator CheY